MLWIALIIFVYVPYLSSLQNFCHEVVLNLVKGLSASIKIISFFFLSGFFSYGWLHLLIFQYIKPKLYLWDETYLKMVGDIFFFWLHSLIQFLRIVLSNYVHEENWSVNLFLCWIFLLFEIQSIYGLKKLIEQCYKFCYLSPILVE